MSAVFGKVTIAGVGLIGGSLGMAARSKRAAERVVGLLRRDEAVAPAVEAGAIDEGTCDPQTAFADADLVIAATPISVVPSILEGAAAHVPKQCILTDVGSTKAHLVAWAEQALSGGIRFVGGHPIAGSEKGGVEAATPDLLAGCPYVLTPSEKTDRDALQAMKRFVEAIGAVPIVLDPGVHDRILATTSHLPHLVASALILCVGKAAAFEPLTRELKAGGLRDTTRIAAGDPVMWRDVLITNAAEVVCALGLLTQELEALSSALMEGDAERIEELLTAAAEVRASIFETE
jgi:prephenate dehydrogenase